MAERLSVWAGDFDCRSYDAQVEMGPPGWLGFIKEVGHDLKQQGFDNPFTGEGIRLNPYFTLVAGNHTYNYVEEYWVNKSLAFAVFLDNPGKFYRVECYKQEYVDTCEKYADRFSAINVSLVRA